MNKLKKNKNFYLLVDKIINKSSSQKIKILKFINSADSIYYKRAEAFSKEFIRYLKNEKINIDFAIKAYLKLCTDIMMSQKYFIKFKKYPVEDEKKAYKEVYDNKKEMKSYMIGIGMSQFLWPTHYAMYSFFIDKILNKKSNISRYLEIGPGHGLFLLQALRNLKQDTKFEIVDISKTSIKITKSIIDFLVKKEKKINYTTQNIFDFESSNKFDFITIGEVLEHVTKPQEILKKIKKLMNKNGTVYLSTCVDCPSIDHVYHFKSIGDIEKMIKKSGFKILDRRILPVEDKPMKEIIKKKITINYCAHLSN
tara:strand:- start:21681 stop:22610 length:930 start_codon:yes stop_codon:yes gene_type:complete